MPERKKNCPSITLIFQPMHEDDALVQEFLKKCWFCFILILFPISFAVKQIWSFCVRILKFYFNFLLTTKSEILDLFKNYFFNGTSFYAIFCFKISIENSFMKILLQRLWKVKGALFHVISKKRRMFFFIW